MEQQAASRGRADGSTAAGPRPGWVVVWTVATLYVPTLVGLGLATVLTAWLALPAALVIAIGLGVMMVRAGAGVPGVIAASLLAPIVALTAWGEVEHLLAEPLRMSAAEAPERDADLLRPRGRSAAKRPAWPASPRRSA